MSIEQDRMGHIALLEIEPMPYDPRPLLSYPTWAEVYAILFAWLLAFLGLVHLLDWVKAIL